MSEHLPIGLYKGPDEFSGEIVFIYNAGGEYGWSQWGPHHLWDRRGCEYIQKVGWFLPALIRWITLTPSNELEFLVLTGKEFKVPDGT